MPYKFNESRRHKIPKARYRVTNWPEYDAALMRRGSLTLWFTEEAVEAWHGTRSGRSVTASEAHPTHCIRGHPSVRGGSIASRTFPGYGIWREL
jgi:hypothetical protein